MRIRLLIERNELPSVSILWSFTPTQLTSTIAQFLENVNVRFPLEGNTWGLEDYTVSLGGYEAQHYTKVGEVFKEDDEVVIKPLLFAEARARTLTGRYQITPDGRRLVDGIPFGKPLLKRMRRPEVNIPPARKRPRVEAAEDEQEEAELEELEEALGMVRYQEVDAEDDDDEDDEDDSDFEDPEDGENEDDEAEDDIELEDSEDEVNEEIEEANWDDATKWRVPIRAIYSKHCCLKKKYLVLVWDEDKQHFNLTCGEDFVRLPGSDRIFTISKKDVAVSYSTVYFTTDRADHRAILRASSDVFKIIEFKDEMAISFCYIRLMEATDQTMKCIELTDDEMQSDFAKQRKLLLAARAKLRDDDEDEDFDDFDSSDTSSDSESGQENVQQGSGAVSDDNSDSSDSDSSSVSSSSDDDAGVDGAKERDEDDSDSSSSSSGSNASWNGIQTSDAVATASAAAVSEPQLPLPHKGAARTKERNMRRREASRLKHLKGTGELPSSTTLQQMQEWLRTGELPRASDEGDGSAAAKSNQKSQEMDAVALELEKKRQQLINDINGGGIDVSSESTIKATPSIHASMLPPQLKKSKKKSKAPTLTTDDDRPEEIPIATEPVIVYPVLPTPAADTEASPSAVATEGPKRVSAAQRLIYGSLGLRAPKTQADKDALQKKLADRSKKSAAEVPVAEQEVEDEDPEAWREKVVISAVECVDEGVTLSEPPFPFQQKWDPQYWSQNIKKRNASSGQGSKNKKRKKNGGGEVVEVYDKYNQDGGGDALNYDDPIDEEDEEWDDGEDWQEGALLGADEDEEDDGFPALPEDVSILASLSEADAKVGDFVVFTEMACSDATGWQPKIVTTVGCLDANHEGDWTVRFSARGGKKEYDDEGNRIYKKFEMEGYDDDDAEENSRQMQWAEMMDVKLLRRPDVVEEQAGEIAVSSNTAAGGVEEQIQSQLEGETGVETSSTE